MEASIEYHDAVYKTDKIMQFITKPGIGALFAILGTIIYVISIKVEVSFIFDVVLVVIGVSMGVFGACLEIDNAWPFPVFALLCAVSSGYLFCYDHLGGKQFW